VISVKYHFDGNTQILRIYHQGEALLLDAREANGLVSGILSVSQVLVAPFDGILRTDALHASGSTLDITAIVAFVGVTVIELIVLWAIGLFRRQPA
jgi:hypothetical protein